MNQTEITDSTVELEHLQSLLDMERDFERKEFEESILETSLHDRQARGTTWYPVSIADIQYEIGENIVVTVTKNPTHKAPAFFQAGQVVSLFSNREDMSKKQKLELRIYGVLSKVKENALNIHLYVSDLPDWMGDGKLGVDLSYNEHGYKIMKNALNNVVKAKHNRLSALREILYGLKKPEFSNGYKPTLNHFLNSSQLDAVKMVLNSPDVAIIHGPPGTGKTTTLVAAIQETLLQEKQVLVTASSNYAVDLLTEKLLNVGIQVIRMGSPARISDKIWEHTFDSKLYHHPEYSTVLKLKKEAMQERTQALKFKRSYGSKERENRKTKLQDSKELLKDARLLEQNIISQLMEESQVICSTLTNLDNHLLKGRTFQTTFVDEATQAIEPALWIAIAKSERIILAGDHKQLPPTVKSPEAAKGGLEITLFEKFLQNQKSNPSNYALLNVQYRMNQKISEFSNREFYDGKIQTYPSIQDAVLQDLCENNSDSLANPVLFIDTAGCDCEEEYKEETKSYANAYEADLLYNYLQLIDDFLSNKTFEITTGILSPYKDQVELLKNKLEQVAKFENSEVEINTIDSFQGREKDIIFISLVRSNSNGEIGFLSDIRRMNVAMTRAKKLLVVIGDSSTISSHPFYNRFLEYAEEINSYKSAWEFMDL